MLGFSRLSAAAYTVIARVIDEDGIFRARVADAAEEAEVGRASWLWLHRPVGWLDDPALAGGEAPPVPPTEPSVPGSARRDEKAAASRLRRAAADADAARRRAAEQLAGLRRTEAEVRAERDALAASISALQEERNAAVRRSKEVEAQLAAARRDLKLARQATMDAEVELAQLRSAGEPPRPAAAAPVVVAPTAPAEPPAPMFDRAGVAASVASAAAAAGELAAALAEAAEGLVPLEAPVVAPPSPSPSPSPRSPLPPSVDGPSSERGTGKGHKKGHKKHRKKGRTPPTLPPGVFDGTAEAHRHLIGDGTNLVVVDGYNLARAAWSGLAPEEERRRTVTLLEDVQARSGGSVIVLFDGDDAVTAPKASRSVRVRFSATGQTADDAIVDLLAATPAHTPVVVVSSDRAVEADARRQGAVAIGARDFLAAAGR